MAEFNPMSKGLVSYSATSTMATMGETFHSGLHDGLDEIEQTSSVEAYFNHFEAIRSLVSDFHPWLPEAYFADRFIYGLRKDIQPYVIRFRPCTVLDVFHLACIYEYPVSAQQYDSKDVIDAHNFIAADVSEDDVYEVLNPCASISLILPENSLCEEISGVSIVNQKSVVINEESTIFSPGSECVFSPKQTFDGHSEITSSNSNIASDSISIEVLTAITAPKKNSSPQNFDAMDLQVNQDYAIVKEQTTRGQGAEFDFPPIRIPPLISMLLQVEEIDGVLLQVYAINSDHILNARWEPGTFFVFPKVICTHRGAEVQVKLIGATSVSPWVLATFLWLIAWSREVSTQNSRILKGNKAACLLTALLSNPWELISVNNCLSYSNEALYDNYSGTVNCMRAHTIHCFDRGIFSRVHVQFQLDVVGTGSGGYAEGYSMGVDESDTSIQSSFWLRETSVVLLVFMEATYRYILFLSSVIAYSTVVTRMSRDMRQASLITLAFKMCCLPTNLLHLFRVMIHIRIGLRMHFWRPKRMTKCLCPSQRDMLWKIAWESTRCYETWYCTATATKSIIDYYVRLRQWCSQGVFWYVILTVLFGGIKSGWKKLVLHVGTKLGCTQTALSAADPAYASSSLLSRIDAQSGKPGHFDTFILVSYSTEFLWRIAWICIVSVLLPVRLALPNSKSSSLKSQHPRVTAGHQKGHKDYVNCFLDSSLDGTVHCPHFKLEDKLRHNREALSG